MNEVKIILFDSQDYHRDNVESDKQSFPRYFLSLLTVSLYSYPKLVLEKWFVLVCSLCARNITVDSPVFKFGKQRGFPLTSQGGRVLLYSSFFLSDYSNRLVNKRENRLCRVRNGGRGWGGRNERRRNKDSVVAVIYTMIVLTRVSSRRWSLYIRIFYGSE